VGTSKAYQKIVLDFLYVKTYIKAMTYLPQREPCSEPKVSSPPSTPYPGGNTANRTAPYRLQDRSWFKGWKAFKAWIMYRKVPAAPFDYNIEEFTAKYIQSQLKTASADISHMPQERMKDQESVRLEELPGWQQPLGSRDQILQREPDSSALLAASQCLGPLRFHDLTPEKIESRRKRVRELAFEYMLVRDGVEPSDPEESLDNTKPNNSSNVDPDWQAAVAMAEAANRGALRDEAKLISEEIGKFAIKMEQFSAAIAGFLK
jgi:hypothetical protein